MKIIFFTIILLMLNVFASENEIAEIDATVLSLSEQNYYATLSPKEREEALEKLTQQQTLLENAVSANTLAPKLCDYVLSNVIPQLNELINNIENVGLNHILDVSEGKNNFNDTLNELGSIKLPIKDLFEFVKKAKSCSLAEEKLTIGLFLEWRDNKLSKLSPKGKPDYHHWSGFCKAFDVSVNNGTEMLDLWHRTANFMFKTQENNGLKPQVKEEIIQRIIPVINQSMCAVLGGYWGYEPVDPSQIKVDYSNIFQDLGFRLTINERSDREGNIDNFLPQALEKVKTLPSQHRLELGKFFKTSFLDLMTGCYSPIASFYANEGNNYRKVLIANYIDSANKNFEKFYGKNTLSFNVKMYEHALETSPLSQLIFYESWLKNPARYLEDLTYWQNFDAGHDLKTLEDHNKFSALFTNLRPLYNKYEYVMSVVYNALERKEINYPDDTREEFKKYLLSPKGESFFQNTDENDLPNLITIIKACISGEHIIPWRKKLKQLDYVFKDSIKNGIKEAEEKDNKVKDKEYYTYLSDELKWVLLYYFKYLPKNAVIDNESPQQYIVTKSGEMPFLDQYGSLDFKYRVDKAHILSELENSQYNIYKEHHPDDNSLAEIEEIEPAKVDSMFESKNISSIFNQFIASKALVEQGIMDESCIPAALLWLHNGANF